MARPERNDVDYFPFMCKEGKVMHYIENKYGNDGYATWFKILRQLAITNYHHLDLSKEEDVMFLSSKCKIDESVLMNIINDLCRLGEFDKELWETKILFSQKFIDSVQDAYKKRNNECITREGVIRIITGGVGKNAELKLEKKPLPSPKAAKATEVVHEYFKASKDLDMWFRDMESGSHIVDMARNTGLPLEVLKANIPAFKKKASVAEAYKNYFDFLGHFKNWVIKPENRISNTKKATAGKALD